MRIKNTFTNRLYLLVLTFLISFMALPQVSFSSPLNLSYEGRVYDSAGNPSQQKLRFIMQVVSPTGCILRAEKSYEIDLSASDGYFSLNIGDVGSGATQHTLMSYDRGNSLLDVFSNKSAALNGKQVSNPSNDCTYTPPNTLASRSIRVLIDDGSTTPTLLSPELKVSSAPYALVAAQAESVMGLNTNDILKINPSTSLSQSNLETVFSTTNYSNLMNLLNGTLSNPTSSTAPATKQYCDANIGGQTAPSLSAGDAGKFLKWDGSTWVIDSVASGSGGGSPSGTASGDLSGSYPGPTVAKINGMTVDNTGLVDGKFFRYSTSGTAKWAANFINISDIRSTVSPYSSVSINRSDCANNQTVKWNSATGDFICSAVTGLDATDITTGTINSARLNITWGQIGSKPTTLSGYGIVDSSVMKNLGSTPGISTGSTPHASPTSGDLFIDTTMGNLMKRYNGSTWDYLKANAYGVAGGDLSGSYPDPIVSKIYGQAVDSTAPIVGQVLKYNTGSPSNKWKASTLTASDIMSITNSAVSAVPASTCSGTDALTYDTTNGTFICKSTGIIQTSASVAHLDPSINYFGIGSTTPNSRLHVESVLSADPTLFAYYSNATTAAGQPVLYVKSINSAAPLAKLSYFNSTPSSYPVLALMNGTTTTTPGPAIQIGLNGTPITQVGKFQQACDTSTTISSTTANTSGYCDITVSMAGVNGSSVISCSPSGTNTGTPTFISSCHIKNFTTSTVTIRAVIFAFVASVTFPNSWNITITQ